MSSHETLYSDAGGGTPGGIMPGGGLNAMNAVMAAGFGGGPSGRIPGGKANGHGGIIPGMPGRGGPMFGLIKRGAAIGNGAFGNLPDLNAAVV